MDGNYIKLCRSILDWEWYGDQNTRDVFIHCLLKANWKDGRFEGHEIPRGSFVTSVAKLSEELGLTNQQTRTALDHLKSTGEITIKTTNKFSVVTVNNYGQYQGGNKQNNNQITNKQQTTNKQLTNKQQTTNNNRRKKEEEEEETGKQGKSNKRFKPPTTNEVREYCVNGGYNIDPDAFIDFYESKGWMVGKNKMKDWKASVRNWARSNNKKPRQEKAADVFDEWRNA